MTDKEGWDMIHTYSRAQAIEDGVLIDVSETAREAGIKYPTAITSAVWSIIEDIPEGSGQDIQGRLWDVCWMLRDAIRRTKKSDDTILYDLIMDRTDTANRMLKLKSVVGPGDDPSPCLTIMLPEED